MFGKPLIHNGNTSDTQCVPNEKKIYFSHTTQSNPSIITLGAPMLVYFHEAEKHKQFLLVLPI